MKLIQATFNQRYQSKDVKVFQFVIKGPSEYVVTLGLLTKADTSDTASPSKSFWMATPMQYVTFVTY